MNFIMFAKLLLYSIVFFQYLFSINLRTLLNDRILYIIINFNFCFFQVIRDYDGSIYMRPHENGGLLFGGFEKESKPIFHESCPTDFENTTLSLDLDHFCEYLLF